jgi:hypothetical protein
MTDKPWESAVSQVSLAGRTDDIAAMWAPWKAAVAEGGDLDWLRGQLETLIESVADNWQGKDGAMFQQKAQSIGDLIDKIQRNYQTMWTCLNTSRATLTEAKKSIPIPVFGGTYLNGTPTTGHPAPSHPTLDYGILYRDYQSTTAGQHYTDFKARAATLLAQSARNKDQTVQLHGQGWGNTTSNIDTNYSINMWAATRQGTPHAMTDTQIQQTANQAATDWYNYNAPLAIKAMETLRTDYAQQRAQLPGPVQSLSGDPWQPGTAHTQNRGSTIDSVTAGSAASFSLEGGGPPGLQTPPSTGWSSGAATAARNSANDVLAPQPTTSGLSGSGHPAGASPTGGLGLGGSNGAGSPGGSAGGPTSNSTLPAGSGSWAVTGAGPVAEPLGTASDPQSFLKLGTGVAGRSSNSGMGMMGPGYGAGGAAERDEHHAWLTEDEDVWSIGRDNLPPDLT